MRYDFFSYYFNTKSFDNADRPICTTGYGQVHYNINIIKMLGHSASERNNSRMDVIIIRIFEYNIIRARSRLVCGGHINASANIIHADHVPGIWYRCPYTYYTYRYISLRCIYYNIVLYSLQEDKRIFIMLIL